MTTLVLLEGCAVFVATSGALLIWRAPPSGWPEIVSELATAAGVALSVLLSFSLVGLYSVPRMRSVKMSFQRMVPAVAAIAILLLPLCALVPAAWLGTRPPAASLLTAVVTVLGLLLPLRAVASRLLPGDRFVERVLIVGSSVIARRLIDEIEARPDGPHIIAGVVGEGAEGDPAALPANGGSVERLDQMIDEVRPDRIVIALADHRKRLPIQRLLEARVYRGLQVEDGVKLYERISGKLAIEALTPTQLLFYEGFHRGNLALLGRRSLSVLVAVLGIVATAPLWGLIALAIKLDSRGPVLFRQRRIGFRGEPFTLFKFRTMHPTAKPLSEWAKDNGHRITPVGRWLRRFWLDELPQLVNVLRGDMNLVGPRPHPVTNYELLVLVSRNAADSGEPIPYYTLRCMVRPGLTGWAQVRYRYANDLDEEIEKLRYDLYYIRHLSLWLDLRVLFDTMKILLRGRRTRAAVDSAPSSPRSTEARVWLRTDARAALAGVASPPSPLDSLLDPRAD